MGDNLRIFKKNFENLSERVYKRSLKVWMHKLMSFNSFSDESRLIPHTWPSYRSPLNRYSSLLVFNSKTNISSLWNKARYSFCDRTTQSPQFWSLTKSYFYCQTNSPIFQGNEDSGNHIEKKTCKSLSLKR